MKVFTPENGFVVDSGLGYDEIGLNRLNERHRVFLEPNIGRIKGKRVLDLASHDGRWSYASLLAGADHVTGVEFRQENIDKSSYVIKGEMRRKVRFIQGNIFDILPKLVDQDEHFDVILCLGVLYHVVDHHRLIKLMTAFKPSFIIVDTVLIDNREPFIKLKIESSKGIRNGAPDFAGQKNVAVGVPSRGGIRLLARTFGYSVRYAKWERKAVKNQLGLLDYFWSNKIGARRFTLYLESI